MRGWGGAFANSSILVVEGGGEGACCEADPSLFVSVFVHLFFSSSLPFLHSSLSLSSLVSLLCSLFSVFQFVFFSLLSVAFSVFSFLLLFIDVSFLFVFYVFLSLSLSSHSSSCLMYSYMYISWGQDRRSHQDLSNFRVTFEGYFWDIYGGRCWGPFWGPFLLLGGGTKKGPIYFIPEEFIPRACACIFGPPPASPLMAVCDSL